MSLASYKKIGLPILVLVAFVPAIAFALPDTFKGIICQIIYILDLLFPILSGAAFLFFFWGLSKYVINTSGNAAELQKGKNYMLWAIAILFIFMTFRAIIGLITNEFEFTSSSKPGYPFLPGSAQTATDVCGSITSVNSNINFSNVPTP